MRHTAEPPTAPAASLQSTVELQTRLAMLQQAAAAIQSDMDAERRDATADEANEITAIHRWFVATEKRIARLDATG